MTPLITFLKVIFLSNQIIYKTCQTDLVADCKYGDFNYQGITTATLGRCGSNPKNLFIGPLGEQTTVTKAFSNVPSRLLEFSFDLWKLDSWDGETIEIKANGIRIYRRAFNHESSGDVCLQSIFSDDLVHISQTFAISGRDLIIKIADSLDQSLEDESWGFRNVILKAIIPCVYFYSECDYQGSEFQICYGEQVILQREIPFQIKSISICPQTIVKLKSPKYNEGVLLEFTSSQSCLDSYQFPRQIQPE